MGGKKSSGGAGGISTRSAGNVDGKKKSVSRAQKAGLNLSVSKIHNHMCVTNSEPPREAKFRAR